MNTEESVGISAFATPGAGFLAATKQRYSDFIVREVDLKGQPVPLTLLPSAFLTAASDEPLDSKEVEAKAVAMLGEAQARQVLSLEALAADGQAGEELVLAQDDDKNHRREVHQLVKAWTVREIDLGA